MKSFLTLFVAAACFVQSEEPVFHSSPLGNEAAHYQPIENKTMFTYFSVGNTTPAKQFNIAADLALGLRQFGTKAAWDCSFTTTLHHSYQAFGVQSSWFYVPMADSGFYFGPGIKAELGRGQGVKTFIAELPFTLGYLFASEKTYPFVQVKVSTPFYHQVRVLGRTFDEFKMSTPFIGLEYGIGF